MNLDINTIPLSLYIHFPWCIKKCPYCDFNSHTLQTTIPEKAYIKRLLEDLDASLPLVPNRRLFSIFIGGGTPSLFTPEHLNDLLKEVKKRIPFEPNIEITLEANPGTVDEKRFLGFFQAGINRLSIGIQSFNPKHLKILGRAHNSEMALSAIEKAKAAGFTNFNLDLMHGLPDQTVSEAIKDLEKAIQFNPPHISWYQLTIEPNTIFYKKPPNLPSENILAEIQTEGEKLLSETAYFNYEVSAFAKDQQMSQHNLNYWQFGDYLGIGAGAHQKISLSCPDNIQRSWRVRQPNDYLNPKKNLIAGSETIALNQLSFEFMLNAMRLNKPITRSLFESRTGLNWTFLEPSLQSAAEKKLLSFDAEKIILTVQGKKFLNNLLELFLK